LGSDAHTKGDIKAIASILMVKKRSRPKDPFFEFMIFSKLWKEKKLSKNIWEC
jgi:hypothetical protein